MLNFDRWRNREPCLSIWTRRLMRSSRNRDVTMTSLLMTKAMGTEIKEVRFGNMMMYTTMKIKKAPARRAGKLIR